MSSSSSPSLPHMSALPPPGGPPRVLLFWAPWHEESSSGEVYKVVSTLSTLFPTICFGRVEAEQCGDLSEQLNVSVIPTICLLDSNNNVKETLTGNDVSQITQAVKRLEASSHSSSSSSSTAGSASSVAAPAVPPQEEEEESLDDRLKRLIHSFDVMLFMKGTPDAPRCGFSRQAVQLLQSNQISFGSFDILEDNDVRQGLKVYSDWPTYPQLYANGELVGGLDILQEMAQDGDLAEQLGVAAQTTTSTPPPLLLKDRLDALVKRHRVMLFMKGLPSAPQCGFSRQAVELLDRHGAVYDSFNILQDDEVRQGLKEYSDWPTYPQLYVEGDLIGGLDIMKEMDESGDLKELLIVKEE